LPRYLALDGDTPLIQLLSANVKADSVRLEGSLAWADQPVTSANAAEIGARLREQMKAAGIAPAPLLACVGRDRVVLKELKIPSVPDHEEPGLVRFQAMKEFTDGGDEVVLDYAPLGPAGPTGRRVQVMSVRKELVQAYRKLAEAAGLKLAALTPRPHALLAGLKLAIKTGLVPGVDPDGAPAALLVRGPKWGEFLIVRDGAMSLSRNMAGPALASDGALLGDLRRNLALYANQNPDRPVRALYLAEADTPGGLRERLQDSLAIPVHAYEPVIGVAVPDGPSGALAGLAGLFAIHALREPGINFAHPREPRAPRDPNKSVLGWGALALVVVLGVLFSGAYLRIRARKGEVALLKKELDSKNRNVRDFEEDVVRIKALDEWNATDVNWLDELYELAARMKDTKNVQLMQIIAAPSESLNVKTTSAKDKPKEVATVKLKGETTANSTPLNKFLSELAEDKYYRVSPKNIKSKRTRGIFVQEFATKFELQKRPPAAYTRTITLPASSAKRSTPGDAVKEGGSQ